MKIIEGMKKLRLLEKKIEQNCERIRTYASACSTDKLPYDTEDRQRKEVQSLIQSSKDMMEEYLRLKAAIDHTNLTVTVSLQGEERTIHEWLWIKRKLGNMMHRTYSSLTEDIGRSRVHDAPTIGDERPQVIRLYDEEDKVKALDKWQSIVHEIDPRLEVINATTEIMEN